MASRLFFKKLFKWRRYVILLLIPLLLLPLPVILPSKESKCAYAILIMAVYWVTEVVPLAVTALLPLVLFPLLGVVGSKEISPPYFKDTTALFVGGLIVAVAIENCNLHKRIALRVLLLVGSKPRRLMLGFMSITAFLSMWISNTATTAMMVPIAEAVLQELKAEHLDNVEGTINDADVELTLQNTTENTPIDGDKSAGVKDEGNATEKEVVNDAMEVSIKIESQGNLLNEEKTEDDDKEDEDDKDFFSRMHKALVLCIAYAANVGGTATLTGTGTNLVFNGQQQSIFPNSPNIGFAQWFSYAFPQMLLLLIVSWLWLQFFFLGCFRCKSEGKEKDKRQAEAIKRTLRNQYKAMGPMTFAETVVLCHFVILALLWLLRDPKFMPGWAIAFEKGYARDATAALLIAFSLFIFPSEKPKIFCWNPEGKVTKPPPPVLTWKVAAQKMPWNVVFLLGGGFALAEAAQRSGLSLWLGYQLRVLASIPDFGIVLIVSLMTCAFTEVTSNVATATIFLPILGTVAQSIGVHPWYFMIPATISCSFAFMLPVATPPNAIVFSYGYLKVKDMAKAGLGMNIFGIVVLMICIHLYGTLIFGLDTIPEWSALPSKQALNYTLVCKNVTV